MQLFQVVIILAVTYSKTCVGHGDHGHGSATQPSTHGGIPDKTVDFHDPKVTQDEAHLKEHLKDEMNTDRQMSPQEMEFHYFRLHDTNNDTRLDGLEILAALSHMVPFPEIQQHEKVGKTEEQIEILHKERSDGMLKYYTDIVDRVLFDDDYDHDGYLTYTEFAMARRRDEYRYQEQMAAEQQQQQMAMMQQQQQQMQYQQQQQWQQFQQWQQQQKPGEQKPQLPQIPQQQQYPPGVPQPQIPQQQQYPPGVPQPQIPQQQQHPPGVPQPQMSQELKQK